MSENFSPGDMSPEEKRTLLAKLLKEKASQITSVYPASDGQRAMFIVQSLSPKSHAYHIAFSVRIHSEVNVAILRRAIKFVIDRHPALTTTYALRDDDLVQNVAEWQEATFEQVDASAWSEAELYQQVKAVFQKPFDLINGPVSRWQLFTHGIYDHVFMFSAHHISIDAWSLGVLLKDLHVALQAYSKGSTPNLPPMVHQYSTWSKWQAEMLISPAGELLKSYWKQQLADNLTALNLIPDFPRPAGQSYKGDSIWFTMASEQSKRIKTLAQSEGNTLFMFLLAAFQVLLHRYTGQEEILVGTPTSGRTQAEYNGVVGYFVNPVALRGQLEGNPTFRELLARNRQIVISALENQDYPFMRVVQNLESRPDPGRSPVFQCMFNMLKFQPGDINASLLIDVGAPRVEFGGMQVSSYPLRQQEGQFELTLDVMDNGENLTFLLNYQTDLFHRQTITRLMRSLVRLLDGLIETPASPISELPILSPEERRQILVEWNETVANFPLDLCLQQFFEAQVVRTPDAVAVVYEEQTLTYHQLNSRANQMAHWLQAQGVKQDSIIGIFMERSLEMVIAIYSTLKAGGAYMPIDPTYPSDRVTLMLDDAQPAILLTQSQLKDSLTEVNVPIVAVDSEWALFESQSITNPPNLASPQNIAYIIYTSGSTGKPKGAIIHHRAIVNHMCWFLENFPLTSTDVVLQKTPFSFDASVWEFHAPLIAGAQLVMAQPGGHQDGYYLTQIIQEKQVTILQVVPTLLQLLIESEDFDKCISLRRVFCGGEILNMALVQRFYATLKSELINLYGPTETAIDTVYWCCDPSLNQTSALIGRPVSNTQTYVLDDHLNPVPIGVSGELYIGGNQVGLGYLNRHELTAQRFIPDPFKVASDTLLYKTGDQVRYREDGNLEYIGRIDNQVKIRGFRIELGEIESILNEYPAILQCVVIVREDNPGDKRLVAYYSVESGNNPTQRELRGFLRGKLPSHMIPSAYVNLETFPMLHNGKFNRRGLPAPIQSNVEIQTQFNPPTTTNELLVAEIWKELLHVDRINVFDNFFDLGGHSLLAMRVVAQIQEKCGIRIEPAYLRIESLGQLALRLNDSSS